MAKDLKAERGKPAPIVRINHIQGVHTRRIDLAQGLLASIDAGRRKVSVQWRQMLERFGGRQVKGGLRGRGSSLSPRRGLRIELPST